MEDLCSENYDKHQARTKANERFLAREKREAQQGQRRQPAPQAHYDQREAQQGQRRQTHAAVQASAVQASAVQGAAVQGAAPQAPEQACRHGLKCYSLKGGKHCSFRHDQPIQAPAHFSHEEHRTEAAAQALRMIQPEQACRYGLKCNSLKGGKHCQYNHYIFDMFDPFIVAGDGDPNFCSQETQDDRCIDPSCRKDHMRGHAFIISREQQRPAIEADSDNEELYINESCEAIDPFSLPCNSDSDYEDADAIDIENDFEEWNTNRELEEREEAQRKHAEREKAQRDHEERFLDNTLLD